MDENNFEFLRRRVDNNKKRFSLPNENLNTRQRNNNINKTSKYKDKNGVTGKRKTSEDIRSVAELFSIRRNTACSLHSFNSSLEGASSIINGCGRNEVSLLPKSNSIQSFGHLSIQKDIHQSAGHSSVGGGLIANNSNNLTVVQVHNGGTVKNRRKFDDNCSIGEFRKLLSRLYTPTHSSGKDTTDSKLNIDETAQDESNTACSLDDVIQLPDCGTPVYLNNGADFKRNSDSRQRNSDGKQQFYTDDTCGTTAIDDILKIRDRLYTPLTRAHRDCVVADCVPYERQDIDDELFSSVVELRNTLQSRVSSPSANLNRILFKNTNTIL